MKSALICFAVFFLIESCLGQKPDSRNGKDKPVRPAVFAGKFYPADPVKLTSAIKAFLGDARSAVVARPVAIIVPHAGYIFSGQIAADGFNQAKDGGYDLIVVLGTNHTTAGFDGVAVYDRGAFDTPIGPVAVDDSASGELIDVYPDAKVNLPVHENEHSIEVQMPFIRYLFPRAKILPVIVSETKYEKCEKFGRALARVVKERRALIVASSDLSHYPSPDDAENIDRSSLDAIAELNAGRIDSEFRKNIEAGYSNLSTCACGEAPIKAAIAAARELGAARGTIISYSNSGLNPAGNPDHVVGYGAVAIGAGEARVETDGNTYTRADSFKLDSRAKAELLKYARSTLERIFLTETVPLPRNLGASTIARRGAFVTLRKHGELRGCIGNMSDNRPLATVVGAMALQAAFNDPRFQPVDEKELEQLEIEISVLTPFREIKSSDEISMGRDGVVLRKGNRHAVFLPQVATETGWNKEMFLDQLCLKAGLSAGDWKDARLFTFQAEVFGESEFEKSGNR